jgi:O-antigen/teichoic acid export membrane protein
MVENSSNQNRHLISGGRLARNTVWNLLGTGVPLAVAVFSIPILIRELGKERFGVLALVWAVIGYASVFDLGVGRALTQLVAKKLGEGERHEVPSLARTSLLLMLMLGLIGTVAVILISPWLVRHALRVPAAMQTETLRSFYLLGFSIPFVITTAGLRGLLEAHQRFALTNALRIPMGVFTFLGPLLVLPFTRNLAPIVAVLLLGRLLGCGAHMWACLRVIPGLGVHCSLDRSYIFALLRFGSWMTVTNLVSPLMVTLDRFLIGALLSVAAVTYYVTPFEVVTKILLIPAALMGVVFPAFSTASGQDRGHTALLFDRSIRCVSMTLFPLILLVVVFAQDGLKLWLGIEFAQHSARVLQWLGIGVFISSLASIPFAFLQGIGRPDLTAKVNLLELPLYLLTVWSLTKLRGVEGTAIAWTLRMAVDAAILFWLSARVAPESARSVRRIVMNAAGAVAVLSLAAIQPSLESRIFFLVLALAGFVIVNWRRIVRSGEWLLAQKPLKASELLPGGES